MKTGIGLQSLPCWVLLTINKEHIESNIESTHYPVIWHKMKHAGIQFIPWNSQNKRN